MALIVSIIWYVFLVLKNEVSITLKELVFETKKFPRGLYSIAWFDCCYLQQSTLDRAAMQEIGFDKSTQHQIGMYLENYPNVSIPSAS